MKLLIDFFPLLLFFVAYKFSDIYVATGVAIAATIVQIAWLKLARGKVEPMQWLSLGIIVVFGGATIALHDPTFIKWKPSILYWVFAAVLAAGQLVLRKNLLKFVMGNIEMPDAAWRLMNWLWAGFFLAMGFLNIWVAYNFSESTWATFKVFGMTALFFVFAIGQAVFMGRYVKEPEEAGTEKP